MDTIWEQRQTDNNRGVTVTPTSLTVNEGGSGMYTVVLDTQPTGTVTIVAVTASEVTVATRARPR